MYLPIGADNFFWVTKTERGDLSRIATGRGTDAAGAMAAVVIWTVIWDGCYQCRMTVFLFEHRRIRIIRRVEGMAPRAAQKRVQTNRRVEGIAIPQSSQAHLGDEIPQSSLGGASRG